MSRVVSYGPGSWFMIQGCELWSRVAMYGPGLWVMVQGRDSWSRVVSYGPGSWCMVQGCELWSRVVMYGPGLWVMVQGRDLCPGLWVMVQGRDSWPRFRKIDVEFLFYFQGLEDNESIEDLSYSTLVPLHTIEECLRIVSHFLTFLKSF